MAAQEHGPPLGETLFGPGHSVVPEPFLLSLVRDGLNNGSRSNLFQSNSVGKAMVVKEANMLTHKLDMALEREVLVPRLQAARSTLLMRGRQPMTLWLTQQGPADATLSQVTTQFSDIPFTHLHLGMDSITPRRLLATVQRMQALTNIQLAMPLDDPMLAVLLKHAPHVKHITLSSMQLNPATQHTSTCSWETLTLTERQGQPAQPAYNNHPLAMQAQAQLQQQLLGEIMMPQLWDDDDEDEEGEEEEVQEQAQRALETQLTLLPVTSGCRVAVRLPDHKSSLVFTARQHGLSTEAAAKLCTNFTYPNLHSVVVQPAVNGQASAVSVVDAQSLLLSLSPLSTLGTTAELRGWPLKATVVAAVAAAPWSKVRFTNTPPQHNNLDFDLISNANHLRHLHVSAPLSDRAVMNLLHHAPHLTHLCVTEITVTGDVRWTRRWPLERVTVQRWHPEEGLRRLGRLPQPNSGNATVEVKRLGTKDLALPGVSNQGFPPLEAAALSVWTLVGFNTVTLRKQAALPAEHHHTALHKAFTQLQQQRGWVEQLRLKGDWVLTPGVAQELGKVMTEWPRLAATEVRDSDKNGFYAMLGGTREASYQVLPLLVDALHDLVISWSAPNWLCTITRNKASMGAEIKSITFRALVLSSAQALRWAASLAPRGHRLVLDECSLRLEGLKADEAPSGFSALPVVIKGSLKHEPISLHQDFHEWVDLARSVAPYWPHDLPLNVPVNEFKWRLQDQGPDEFSAEFAATWVFPGTPTVVVWANDSGGSIDPGALQVTLAQLQSQKQWVQQLKLHGGWLLGPTGLCALQEALTSWSKLERVEVVLCPVNTQLLSDSEHDLEALPELLPAVMRGVGSLSFTQGPEGVVCAMEKTTAGKTEYIKSVEFRGLTVSSVAVVCWGAALAQGGHKLVLEDCTVTLDPLRGVVWDGHNIEIRGTLTPVPCHPLCVPRPRLDDWVLRARSIQPWWPWDEPVPIGYREFTMRDDIEELPHASADIVVPWMLNGPPTVVLCTASVPAANKAAAVATRLTKLQSQQAWVQKLRLECGWVAPSDSLIALQQVLAAWPQLTVVEVLCIDADSLICAITRALESQQGLAQPLWSLTTQQSLEGVLCTLTKPTRVNAEETTKSVVLTGVTLYSATVADCSVRLTAAGYQLVLEDCTVQRETGMPEQVWSNNVELRGTVRALAAASDLIVECTQPSSSWLDLCDTDMMPLFKQPAYQPLDQPLWTFTSKGGTPVVEVQAPHVMLTEQLHSLRTSLLHLQSQQGWLLKLRLEGGWVLTPEISHELQTALKTWPELTTVEVVHSTGALDRHALVTITCTKTADASEQATGYQIDSVHLVCRDLIVTTELLGPWLQLAPPGACTVVLQDCTALVRPQDSQDTWAHLDQPKASVQAQGSFADTLDDVLALDGARTPADLVERFRRVTSWWPSNKPIKLDPCELVFDMTQDTEVQDIVQASCRNLFDLSQVSVVLAAPPDMAPGTQGELFRRNCRALNAFSVSPPRSIMLSRWCMHPQLLADLPSRSCPLIFASDLQWPSAPAAWLQQPLLGSLSDRYTTWQFADSISVECIVALCSVLLRRHVGYRKVTVQVASANRAGVEAQLQALCLAGKVEVVE